MGKHAAVAQPQIDIASEVAPCRPLWDFDVAELAGHNLESRGRKIVNRLLADGWRLHHIYTLRYENNGTWRERPMAILGRLREGKDTRDARCTPARTRSGPERFRSQRPVMEVTAGGTVLRDADAATRKNKVVATTKSVLTEKLEEGHGGSNCHEEGRRANQGR